MHHVVELLLDRTLCSLATNEIKTSQLKVFNNLEKILNLTFQMLERQLLKLVDTA